MIKLLLKSFNPIILNKYLKQIILFFKKNYIIYNVICLPKKIKKFSLLRSPHIDKNSMDQIEYRIYKYKIFIKKITRKKFIELLKFNLPSIINCSLI